MYMMNNPEVQRLAQVLHQEVVPGAQPQPQAGNSLNPNATAQQGMPNMPNAPQPPQGTDANSQAVIEGQAQQVNQNVAALPKG